MSGHGTPIPMTSRKSGPLKGVADVPGDKSISHRSLLLGAMAVGETRVTGLLEGEDVLATAAAMRAFGADVERLGDGEWRVNGVGVGEEEHVGVLRAGGARDAAPRGVGLPGPVVGAVRDQHDLEARVARDGLARDGLGVVGAAVEREDDAESGVRLLSQRLDQGGDGLGLVVGGHDDGEGAVVGFEPQARPGGRDCAQDPQDPVRGDTPERREGGGDHCERDEGQIVRGHKG